MKGLESFYCEHSVRERLKIRCFPGDIPLLTNWASENGWEITCCATLEEHKWELTLERDG